MTTIDNDRLAAMPIGSEPDREQAAAKTLSDIRARLAALALPEPGDELTPVVELYPLFIRNAADDLRWLVGEVERLRAERDAARCEYVRTHLTDEE